MTIQLTVDTSKQLTAREKFILKAIINADEMVDALNEPIEQEEKEEPPATDLELDPKPEVIPEPVEAPPPPPKKDIVLRRRGKYMDKICVDCKKVFSPKSGRSERCPECQAKHQDLITKGQRDRQRERRRAASAAKKDQAKTPVKAPAKPTTISCKRCHKPYTPAPEDKNGYCPKCLDKIRNAPKLKPLNKIFTVQEVMAMPVLERYRYAYQWTYAERQQALALKPLGALTPEEHEFFNRCQSGDFMAD